MRVNMTACPTPSDDDCAAACGPIVVVYAASALAEAGEEPAGSVSARETSVARVSAPAVAIAILRERLADRKERLADRKEGRGKCLAKRKPLLARAVRDRLPPLTPRSAR